MLRAAMFALSFAVVGLAPVVAWAQTETVLYYHTDAIGSVRMITNEAGQVVGRYDYWPFGGPAPTDPPAPPEVRQFAGKERDTATGYDYFGGRYYQSLTGRFTTVDPVLDIQQAMVDPQRWNRYGYALNNPLRYTDPDGRVIWLAAAYAIFEAASTAYDYYTTYQTVTDPNAALPEKLESGGWLAAGALLPGPGGAYRRAEKAIVGYADELVTVARTTTDRLIQHTTRTDLVGAAREVATGVRHGGQHVKEVREAARGLRARIADLRQGLSNPRLSRDRRLALESELGLASRNLDAAEEALRGVFLQHQP